MSTESQTAPQEPAIKTGSWEERWHPLREEWVVIAAHRQNRPWSGETLEHENKQSPEYVEDCYLCPRNERVGGSRNEDYKGVYVFNNDLPCVGENAPVDLEPPPGIFRNRSADGIARVICYSAKHNVSLAELNKREIEDVIAVWQKQYLELGRRENVNHVLIFENKGEAVGVSNPHPHGQIYATNFVFKTIETEARAAQRHLQETGRVLFADIIEAEQRDGRRVIFENEHAIAFLPYFARYAYEIFVAPKKSHQSVAELSEVEAEDLAEALKIVLVKYDNLWKMPFPYVMPLHNAPTDGGSYGGFHFHIQFHPPLRKPNLLKYLAGPEIGGGNFLSDTLPEEKAEELKAQSEIHYKQELTV
jgi:UDPglucose--hexose-1-phosphate uridylyltransferase